MSSHPNESRARAMPLTAELRRRALITTTIDLIRTNRAIPSTREIALAAGVAEGTIYRVFPTKDALVEAVTSAVFCPGPLLDSLHGIDPTWPLRDRLVAVAEEFGRRYRTVFDVLAPLGLSGPPREHAAHPGCPGVGPDTHTDPQNLIHGQVARLFTGDTRQLRITPAELARLLQMIVFTNCNPHLSASGPLRPEDVADLLLHGVLRHGVPADHASHAPWPHPGDEPDPTRTLDLCPTAHIAPSERP